VAVITLQGRRRMEFTPASVREPGSLGWTYTAKGAVLPFGAVACDLIRAAVREAIHGNDVAGAEFPCGRAPGRLLAHALYPIPGKTSRHTRQSVAQPLFFRQTIDCRSSAIASGRPDVAMGGPRAG